MSQLTLQKPNHHWNGLFFSLEYSFRTQIEKKKLKKGKTPQIPIKVWLWKSILELLNDGWDISLAAYADKKSS